MLTILIVQIRSFDYMDEIPLFAKTENSNVYYAAGWYAINFEKGWKHGNCPKLNTLITYGYEGL